VSEEVETGKEALSVCLGQPFSLRPSASAHSGSAWAIPTRRQRQTPVEEHYKGMTCAATGSASVAGRFRTAGHRSAEGASHRKHGPIARSERPIVGPDDRSQ
jgi:hypothetical protein